MPEVDNDLNAIIASAVNARIEAQIAVAFSSDELLGKYVAAALQQPLEVKDHNSYKTRKTTFMKEAIDNAMRSATQRAVVKLIESESAAIEAAVAKELRTNIKAISTSVVSNMVDAAKTSYGVKVELRYPERS